MIALSLAVFACALVQSVFGVGLLVFGTPLLLFLGYSFLETLFRLLPCSLLVSALQLHDHFDEARGLLRSYLLFLAPAAAVGAVIVFGSSLAFDVRPAVGAMLLLSAMLRASDKARRAVARALAPNKNAGLAVIGLVHGLTNMGGGLLTAMVNALVIDKVAVRAGIALGYLLMASLQLGLILALKGPQAPLAELAVLLALTGAAYLLLGRRLFARSSERLYQHSMTALMALCGLLLLAR